MSNFANILSLVIFLPLIGVALLFFLKSDRQIKWATLIFMVVDFALTIPLVCDFDTSTFKMQYVENYKWIEVFGINYKLGVDGISVLFVFLTGITGWICVLASWTSIKFRVREFMIALLVMQTAMMGVFCSLDLFLFFVFWEAMLIPMFIIILVWGGPNRRYASFKFFLYTFAGSTLFFISILAFKFTAGTFDILTLMDHKFTLAFQICVFLAMFVAFAIKVPMFPFHTWLPDAHVQAPTAGSIILASVLLKMGTYGFLRFSMPMLPDATMIFATPIVILSIVGIIYGAYLALAQSDLKKLIAYSSVAHMGFVTLGLFLLNRNGVEGAILQMFNHGITTGALFLCVGIIYERTHTREIGNYGWAAQRVPFYTIFLFIFSIASLGFPGTNGFIGELLILFGAYESNIWYVLLLLIGIVLGAAYMLWLFQRIAYGIKNDEGYPTEEDGKPIRWEIDFRESVALVTFTIFVFWVGFQPLPFLDIMRESVSHLLVQVNEGACLVSGK